MTNLFSVPVEGAIDAPDNARAMLLIVHGLAEHRGRYAQIVERFNAHGIACCTFDHKGHGRSPGRRGHVDAFDEFVNDASLLIDSVKFKYPELPLFIWGHSMGSLIAILATAARPLKVRGVITSGAPFAAFDRLSALTVWTMKWMSRLAPTRATPLPVDPGRLSRDPKIGAAYVADALIPKFVTVRLLVELYQASARALQAARSLRMPWLALHGGDDRVAPPIGSQRLLDTLASVDKHIRLWPNARHEVHNELEPERTEFLEAIEGFVRERV